MNQLTKYLVDGILNEDKQEVVALYAGGFKPPTAGHFSVVKEALKQYPEIDKLIVLVGGGIRDGIEQAESILVWEIYQNYLPMKVEIQPSTKPPIGAVYSYAGNNPEDIIYWILGARDGKDEDLSDIAKRTAAIDKKEDKYNNVEVKIITTSDAGMSGTNARKALLAGNKETFYQFLPAQVEEKDEIFNILRPAVKEHLYELEDKEIEYWAKHADLFSILKKGTKKYKELAQKLSGERLKALDYFWNNFFNEKGEAIIEQVDFKSLESQLDDMFAELDIDVAFTNHFKERVIERGLTEEDIIELANKIIDKYPDELDFIDKGQNVVMSHLSRLVDIAAVNTGYGDDYLKDLVFKTAYKRKDKSEPEFRTNASSPRLAVNEHSMGDSIDLLPYLSKLTQHMIDKGYNIEPLPGLELIDDDFENAEDFFGKTAYYDPVGQIIVLYTHGRHPKDIARSYAHEMIHHIQNLEGRLGNITTTNTQEDDHLNDIEAEANLKGTMTFRNWTDSLNEIGDASAGAFPFNQSRIDTIVNTLQDKIDNQPDAKWQQHLLPFLKFSSPNADYEVITTAQVDKPLNIPDFQTRPNLIELRVDFTVGESDEATNIGEQYKVMATMTQIIKALMDKVSKIEGSKLRSVKLFAKSDDEGDESDINSRRGKLYQAFVKKNLPQGWEMSTSKNAWGSYIALYPELEEGFNKKLGKDPFGLEQFARELMTEGAYDALTTKLTRATIQKWVEDSKKKPIPKKSFVDIDIDEFDGKGREIDFNYVGLTEFTDKVDGYEVNGTSNSGEDKGKIPFVATLFKINPKVLPQAWSKISADVSDVIRHEIEHLTQAGDNTRSGKYMDDDKMIRDMIDKLKILPKSDYYKLEKEVDAMLQGLYLKAKKTRKPFADVIDQYLDIAPGIDTKEDKEIILNLWRSRRKALSLPVFENEEKVMTNYTIYSDMDGVLSDFDKRFMEFSDGMKPRDYENKFGKEKFWELIDDKVGVPFWAGMDWMPDGKIYWDYIEKYNPIILSAPSRNNESRYGKRIWKKRNMPATKMILAYASDKKNYANSTSILIDDREENIKQWEEAGGIGILHTSAASTIAQLKKLGL